MREGEEESLENLLAALDENGDGKISWPEFEKALSGDATDAKGKPIRALRWRCLSAKEAKARSEEMYVLQSCCSGGGIGFSFGWWYCNIGIGIGIDIEIGVGGRYKLAQKLQMKLGHTDESNEAAVKELQAEILRISQLANRFSVLAQTKQDQQAASSSGSTSGSSNNNGASASTGGRRKGKVTRKAPRGDDIRFFHWDLDQPATGNGTRKHNGAADDWSSGNSNTIHV